MNLQEVFNVITQTNFPLNNLTPLNFHIPTQFENFTETIALLLTAANFCIWQTRLGRLNTDPQNLKPVNHKLVIAKIFNHISTREKQERKRSNSIFVDTINTIKHIIARLLQNPIQMEEIRLTWKLNYCRWFFLCFFFVCYMYIFFGNSVIWPCFFSLNFNQIP